MRAWFSSLSLAYDSDRSTKNRPPGGVPFASQSRQGSRSTSDAIDSGNEMAELAIFPPAPGIIVSQSRA